jgi:hypothetical protein
MFIFAFKLVALQQAEMSFSSSTNQQPPKLLYQLLQSIPALNARLLESVETFNNFTDQMASVREAAPKSVVDGLRIDLKHPDWRHKIRAKLDLLLSESIEDIQCCIAELDPIIFELKNKEGCPLAAEEDSSVQFLLRHLHATQCHYKRQISSIDPGSVQHIKPEAICSSDWSAQRSLDSLLQLMTVQFSSSL